MKKALLFLLVLTPIFLYAQTLTGRVVKISDGDTFTMLLKDSVTVRVRLYGIDCPERGQDYGRAATEYAKKYIDNRAVIVETKGNDRYGRTLGIVYVAGERESLNIALLQSGYAWHYRFFDKNPEWDKYEADARAQKLGLWAGKNPIEPYQYRKKKKHMAQK